MDVTIYTFSMVRTESLYLGKIPTDLDLPVLDKRREIELFDVEEGYRSIGSDPSASSVTGDPTPIIWSPRSCLTDTSE